MKRSRFRWQILVGCLLVAIELVWANYSVVGLTGYHLDRERFVPDPYTGYTMRPGFEGKVNAQGLETPPVGPRRADELRILCLGSSELVGSSESGGPTICQQLQNSLRRRLDRPVRVINGAVEGYETTNVRALLSEVWPVYHPDVVVVALAFHDVDQEINCYTPPEPNLRWKLRLHQMLDRLPLVQAYMLFSMSAPGFGGWRSDLDQGHASLPVALQYSFDSFLNFSTRHHVPLLFVQLPAAPNTRSVPRNALKVLQLHAIQHNDPILVVGKCRAWRSLSRSPWFPADPFHYNREGQRVIAWAIFRELRRRGEAPCAGLPRLSTGAPLCLASPPLPHHVQKLTVRYIGSMDFVVFVLALVLLYYLHDSRAWRSGVLAIGNALFLWNYIAWPEQLGFILWLYGSAYALIWLRRRRSFKGAWIITPVVIVLVSLLGVVREQNETGLFHPTILLVGYSYLMFRIIHSIVDERTQQLPSLSCVDYFNYLFAFYTFVAGPIQRLPEFLQTLDRPRTDLASTALAATDRIANGALQSFVLAPFVLPYTSVSTLEPPGRHFWMHFSTWYVSYYVYLLLNFSGYTDLMIGIALMFGITVPENFRRPFLARNVLDFWTRWHITLSSWIRDYLFTPLYFHLQLASRGRGRVCWIALSYFTAFEVVGFWHGLNSRYVLFGALHGLGAMTNFTANELLGRLPGKMRERYRKSHAIRVCATILSFLFISFTMLVFAHPLSRLDVAGRLLWTRIR